MGKLRQLRGPLPVVKPRLAFLNDDKAAASRARDRVQEHRAWYKTQRWRRLRWQVLVRDLFTCQICKTVEPKTSELVGDHKVPHRGDEVLFWDEGNVWCLCKRCHDSVKQKEEAAARRA
jgi:5-methylcytosine-specific restriction endonuclease McrA